MHTAKKSKNTVQAYRVIFIYFLSLSLYVFKLIGSGCLTCWNITDQLWVVDTEYPQEVVSDAHLLGELQDPHGDLRRGEQHHHVGPRGGLQLTEGGADVCVCGVLRQSQAAAQTDVCFPGNPLEHVVLLATHAAVHVHGVDVGPAETSEMIDAPVTAMTASMCQCSTSTFERSYGCTVLDMPESKEMTEQTRQTGGQSNRQRQVAYISEDLKC